ncbi:LptF/LptG family permease [bacterium]|nr:LptF/LptG family permease [bacterium]
MYLIYRHLLASAAGPFVFGWFVITFLLMIDVLFRYVDLFVSKGVPFFLATKVLALSLGYTFALSVPMAVLIAVLMSVGQMANDNEITAMKACGISLWAVLRPLLFGAALIAAGLTAYNHYVFPRSNHTLANLLYDINRSKPMLEIREQQFTDLSDQMMIYVGSKDDKTGAITNVQIFEKQKPGDLSPRMTVAARGRIVPDHATDSMLIELYDGEIHEVPDPAEPDVYRVIRFKQHNLQLENMERDFQESGRTTRGDREMDLNDLKAAAAEERRNKTMVFGRVRDASATFLDWELGLLDPARRANLLGPDALPDDARRDGALERRFRSARTNAERAAESSRHQQRLLQTYAARENRYMVEFHKKFSIPFACMVFALLGIPMAVTTSRSGKGVSVSLALGVYLVYYAFLMAGEKLADKGLLDPAVAMWSANVFLLVAGVPMFVKAARESSLLSITLRPRRRGPRRSGPAAATAGGTA